MTELTLIGGIFLLALVSAFVPFVSIEVALLLAATAGTSGTLMLAQVIAAAAGQMVGKSCFFVGGRTVFINCKRWRKPHAPEGPQRLRGVIDSATRHRTVASVTVFASATTGLPPFALVSALAGAWRLRLSYFFVVGFAGRALRFGGVLLMPSVVGWQ